MTCQHCHDHYHEKRKDWQAWGRKGIEVRKKKKYYNMAFASHGFRMSDKGEG